MKTRLKALGLLDRALSAASDEDLTAAIARLDDDHLEALAQIVDEESPTPATLREVAASGRLDGGMESIAIVISDECLADCIEQLGDDAERPSSDQLLEIIPGLIERHGVAMVRIMFASTVVGDAPASAVIRDLLKNHEPIALPPAEIRPVAPARTGSSEDRTAIKDRRKALRKERQAEANARRQQSRRDRRRD